METYDFVEEEDFSADYHMVDPPRPALYADARGDFHAMARPRLDNVEAEKENVPPAPPSSPASLPGSPPFEPPPPSMVPVSPLLAFPRPRSEKIYPREPLRLYKDPAPGEVRTDIVGQLIFKGEQFEHRPLEKKPWDVNRSIKEYVEARIIEYAQMLAATQITGVDQKCIPPHLQLLAPAELEFTFVVARTVAQIVYSESDSMESWMSPLVFEKAVQRLVPRVGMMVEDSFICRCHGQVWPMEAAMRRMGEEGRACLNDPFPVGR